MDSIVVEKQKEIFQKLKDIALLEDYERVKKDFEKTYEKLRSDIEKTEVLVEKRRLEKEFAESKEFLLTELKRKKSKAFAPARWIKIETEGEGPDLMVLDCSGDFIISDGNSLVTSPYLSLFEHNGKYYLKRTKYPEIN
jgi:hypothetical protein